MQRADDLFSLVTLNWRKLETKGSVPGARRGGCLVSNGRKILLIGGLDVTKQTATYELDLDTFSWRQLGKSSVSYGGHVCTSVGSTVYIHGGEEVCLLPSHACDAIR